MSKNNIKSSLDIFEDIPVQDAIISSQTVEYFPITLINDSNIIEFEIQGSPDEYVDLQNIFLQVRAKIINKNGSDFADTLGTEENYCPINYSLNTIFDQVSIQLGSTPVSPSSKNYAYLSYIEAITCKDNKYGTQTSNVNPTETGFLTVYPFDAVEWNEPSRKICPMVRKSKEYVLYGRLHGVLFTANKLLLNGVTIRLIFSRYPSVFSCMGRQGWLTNDTFPKHKLLKMSLFVRKVKLSPNVMIAHSKALQISRAIYPVERAIVKVINLSSGQSNFNLPNIFTGDLPKKIIIGFVEQNNYNGTNTTNPFYFRSLKLSNISLNINGETFPRVPYQPAFDEKNASREYNELLSMIGCQNNQINYLHFVDGLTLFPFNLSNDPNSDSNYVDQKRSGFVNLDVKFGANLTNNTKAVIYAVFDNTIEIDEYRNIYTDY